MTPLCFMPFLVTQSKRLQLGVFLIICSINAPAFGQDGKWHSFNEEWVLDKRVSRYEAEMLMLAEARKSVVEMALGINVKSIENVRKFELLSTNGQSNNVWIEEYLNQSIQESNGKITEEKLPVFTVTEREGLTYLSLTYQAKVAQERGNSEPGFTGTFDMYKPAFKEGDTLVFHAQSTRDTWLYVFNVSIEGDFALLYPNQFDKEFSLAANKRLQLPVKANRYAFIAEITNTGDKSTSIKKPQTEIIYALFYKGNEPLFRYSEAMKTEWSFVEFNKLLLQIPRNLRDAQVISYTVYP